MQKRKTLIAIAAATIVGITTAYAINSMQDKPVDEKAKFVQLFAEKAELEREKSQAEKTAHDLATKEQAKIDAINAIRD